MNDEILGKLERIKTIKRIAPFCFEISLRNNKSYFIHSISDYNKDSVVLECRVWDSRTFSDLKTEKAKSLNSDALEKLDWANLKVYKKDIINIIDWHDKYGDNEKIDFWKRKKDEIWLLILGGAIGFIFGIISAILLKL